MTAPVRTPAEEREHQLRNDVFRLQCLLIESQQREEKLAAEVARLTRALLGEEAA